MSTGSVFAGLLATSLLFGCAASSEPIDETEQELGNSAAAHCCRALFPPGPERGQCVSQAAHGLGPCATPDAAVAPPDAAVVTPPDAAVAPPDAAALPDALP
jgi:hypothetical protein